MRHQRTAIAIAVVEQGDAFLVGQRPAGKPLAGCWEFPGGRVEPGESAAQAAVRECLEETGVAVQIVGKYPDGAHDYDHDRVYLSFFACQPISPAAAPRTPFRWVSRGELCHLQFPEANRGLLQLLSQEGVFYLPLLVPEEPLPPYAYVPGKFPHPVRDPAGHAYGEAEAKPPQLPEADEWHRSRAYLRGIDLFNHGYYWEAHEAWESLWHAAGRNGPPADFLKGLIKLAAALVKAREGRPAGVARHAQRAQQLFSAVREGPAGPERYWGLELDRLIDRARQFAAAPEHFIETSEVPVVRLIDWVLRPE